ncbi:hypothetical protein DEO72_LG3g1532 [Vigna unguiculata]|uniref:Uncharacterized protein n=1 Tax=Vigna unguiculata TaxID=3917 RepID=A0A4D6LEG1_VIGUN|nr:hypothetical protein DEO72_LG3g1532 [Vigna unguiculata]
MSSGSDSDNTSASGSGSRASLREIKEGGRAKIEEVQEELKNLKAKYEEERVAWENEKEEWVGERKQLAFFCKEVDASHSNYDINKDIVDECLVDEEEMSAEQSVEEPEGMSSGSDSDNTSASGSGSRASLREIKEGGRAKIEEVQEELKNLKAKYEEERVAWENEKEEWVGERKQLAFFCKEVDASHSNYDINKDIVDECLVDEEEMSAEQSVEEPEGEMLILWIRRKTKCKMM